MERHRKREGAGAGEVEGQQEEPEREREREQEPEREPEREPEQELVQLLSPAANQHGTALVQHTHKCLLSTSTFFSALICFFISSS